MDDRLAERARQDLELETTILNDFTNINTNIRDYTVTDILNLLDIDIDENSTNDEIQSQINDKIDIYVNFFKGVENTEMTKFFEDIRIELFGRSYISKHRNVTDKEALVLALNNDGSIKHVDDVLHDLNKGIFVNDVNGSIQGNGMNNGSFVDSIRNQTITQIMTINSRDRDDVVNTTSADFSVTLPAIINGAIELNVVDIHIPDTYYQIVDSYENNYFWVKYDYTDSGANEFTEYAYIYLPSGSYTEDLIITTINTDMSNNSIPLIVTYDLSYNTDRDFGTGTAKVVIAYDSSNGFDKTVSDLEVNFNSKKLIDTISGYDSTGIISDSSVIADYYDKNNNIDYKQRLGWMLGYRSIIYQNNTTYTSDSVFELRGVKYFYLIVDDLNNLSNHNFINSSSLSELNNKNIIARIILYSYPFHFNKTASPTYSFYTESRKYFGPVNIHKFNIKLIDEFGRTADLNKVDFTFLLQIKTVYNTAR